MAKAERKKERMNERKKERKKLRVSQGMWDIPPRSRMRTGEVKETQSQSQSHTLWNRFPSFPSTTMAKREKGEKEKKRKENVGMFSFSGLRGKKYSVGVRLCKISDMKKSNTAAGDRSHLRTIKRA